MLEEIIKIVKSRLVVEIETDSRLFVPHPFAALEDYLRSNPGYRDARPEEFGSDTSKQYGRVISSFFSGKIAATEPPIKVYGGATQLRLTDEFGNPVRTLVLFPGEATERLPEDPGEESKFLEKELGASLVTENGRALWYYKPGGTLQHILDSRRLFIRDGFLPDIMGDSLPDALKAAFAKNLSGKFEITAGYRNLFSATLLGIMAYSEWHHQEMAKSGHSNS